MADIRTFDLPDLGEGLTEGEILRWLVATGDTVTLNQPIVEVETAKAAVEIPSPYAGVVTALHHEEGSTVEVGSPLIAIDTAPGAASPPPNVPSRAASDATGAATSGADTSPGVTAVPGSTAPDAGTDDGGTPDGGTTDTPGGRTPVLVGYGPRSGPARRRARRALPEPENTPAVGGAGLSGDRAEPAPDETLSLLPTIPDALAAGAKPVRHGGLEMGRAAERAATAAGTVSALPTRSTARPHPATTARPRAKPPVRKLARDLGVDLATVPATGPDGTVSRDDVRRAAASATAVPTEPTQTAPTASDVREQRVPVRGVRKLTAEAMVTSVATAPHVTEFLTVDVTRTLRAVRRLRENPAFADVRVGPLLLVAKAVVQAVRRHPELNACWVDGPDGAEIVLKDYVNLGIAAATPRGLMVPNIKDAGRLTMPELASALDSLVAVAKAGRTPPADLSGGTLTITNVGVFGVDAGTPILNPGEAAILCVGQIAERPWVHKGVVKPRAVCQLALSFDHRIVDGEGGSKFLADVGRFLEDPERTALAWA
ncbi:dihydrolipoamide acetyltransferase family protein [Cryptosporangium minutisporangium]|uniref:Dihydrolipoamide acetyltransferase component of pyruvate dehydrogenase complex n=1 Tax=Cryptosporangium minutisporangium TaxID=113569 RepID=A0ABP6T7B5_9ACTN